VFGQDSTILVDAILSSINTNGTIRSHTTPHVDATYDLGAANKQFKDLYVSGNIPGYVKIADLKTALQDGAGDYAAFKAWVLANL
jgi:hypothetical protein